MKLEVGFIGLGVMGSAMAGHILRAGHKLTVYNRTIEKTETLRLEGASVAKSPGELGQKADLIFICAGDGASVREIIFGATDAKSPFAVSAAAVSVASVSGALVSALRPGAIIVDHSTISPEEALDLSRDLAEIGFEFLDAPITGGDIGAKNGTLTTMVGGNDSALESVRPILNLYSKKICKIGPSGFGQRMKAVNQIGAIGGVALVSELMRFAQGLGLDLAMTLETLSGGGANSFALNNYGPKIINGDFQPGFSVKHSKKDIGIVLSQAEELKLPLTEVIFKELSQAEQLGLAEKGNHVLFNLKG